MASTYTSLNYHIVFSTKERLPLLNRAWRAKMHEYLGGTVQGLNGVPSEIGGVGDHVHLLIGLRATHCVADFVRELKKASSVWAAEQYDRLFCWQEGYAAFTVSPTHVDIVRRYVARQEEHHQKTDYLTEFRRLLARNRIEYDPKYLE